jgi:hypothetical protein
MFQLNLKNTVLRSILKFHNDRLTTAQVIVDTMLQNQFFYITWQPIIGSHPSSNSVFKIQ